MTEKSRAAETPAAAQDAADAAPEENASRAASAAELYSQLLRLKAEFENFRKRVDREKPEWIKLGEVGLLSRLLPLYDVLLKAHDQVKASNAAGGTPKEMIAGLELL